MVWCSHDIYTTACAGYELITFILWLSNGINRLSLAVASALEIHLLLVSVLLIYRFYIRRLSMHLLRNRRFTHTFFRAVLIFIFFMEIVLQLYSSDDSKLNLLFLLLYWFPMLLINIAQMAFLWLCSVDHVRVMPRIIRLPILQARALTEDTIRTEDDHRPTCSICLVPLDAVWTETGHTVRNAYAACRDHVFHVPCLLTWEQTCEDNGKPPSCPICRAIPPAISVAIES